MNIYIKTYSHKTDSIIN